MPSRFTLKSQVAANRGVKHGPSRFMPTLMRAMAGIAVTALISVGITFAITSPAAAENTECDGITVVVEYEGNIETGCAASDVENGLDALTDAGFDVEFVSGIAGMVCQINSDPTEAGECSSAPSANAYWGYWYSDGDEWEFSNAGAGMRSPDAGTIDGWIFGDGGDEPGIDPADARAQAGDSEPTSHEATTEDNSNWWDTYSWMIAIFMIGLVIAGGFWSRQRQARRNDANR